METLDEELAMKVPREEEVRIIAQGTSDVNGFYRDRLLERSQQAFPGVVQSNLSRCWLRRRCEQRSMEQRVCRAAEKTMYQPGEPSLDSQRGKDVHTDTIPTGIIKNESVSTYNIWNHGGY